jgi:hypothetical protein
VEMVETRTGVAQRPDNVAAGESSGSVNSVPDGLKAGSLAPSHGLGLAYLTYSRVQRILL